MSTLYHLTDEQHLEGILREGLKPQHGENCHAIGDERRAIFLCGEKDIGKWRITLGNTVLLEVVDMDLDTLEEFKYSSYNEYVCNYRIPPEDIRVISHDIRYITDDMYELCLSYLITISEFVVDCARYFSSPNQDSASLEDIKYMARGILFVLNNLDYSITEMSEYEEFLQNYGSKGNYTFCDTYGNTRVRLWEQLEYYDVEELHADLVKIRDFVKNTFPFARELCTGGLEIPVNPGAYITSYF